MVQCILDLANGGYVKTMSVKADPPSPCRSICKLENNGCGMPFPSIKIEEHKNAEGIVYWTEGHNAQPISDGRCCDRCNEDIVIPHRIADMMVAK